MVKHNIDTSGSISPYFGPYPCSAAEMDCSERRNLSALDKLADQPAIEPYDAIFSLDSS